MRTGIAKVYENAITEILRDVAVVALNHLRTSLLILLHDVAQVFRIKLCRKRRGAHHVNEHYRQLAAFRRLGLGVRGWGLGTEN